MLPVTLPDPGGKGTERMYIEKVMPDKIKLNMKYLEHYTVGEYFKIIFLTFKSLVK